MEKTGKKSKNKSVQAVPEGFQTVTPYLVVEGADQLIEFLERAFEGECTNRNDDDKGHVMHATVNIGDSMIMIGDAMGTMPRENAMLYLYVENVDEMFQNALDAGATTVRDVRDEFYGDRTGSVKDRWGNTYWIATHIEDVAPDELKERRKKAMTEREEMHSV
jgi:uncharacterized glyoxalase superfamily protein PhnB